MERREFLTGIGALLGTSTLAGCAATPLVDPARVPHWLKEMDRDLAPLRSAPPAPALSATMERAGLPEATFGAMLASLVWVDTLRQSPPEVLETPAVQARLETEGEALGQNALLLADWLDRLPRRQRRKLGRRLRSPLTMLRALERQFIRKDPQRASKRRRELRRVLGGLARLFSKRDPHEIVSELVAATSEQAATVGLSREQWVEGGAAATADVADTTDTRDAEADALEQRSAKVRKRGWWLVGIALSGAVITWSIDFILGAFYSCTVGAALLLVGIGMLIAAAIFTAEAEELRSQVEQSAEEEAAVLEPAGPDPGARGPEEPAVGG